MRHAAVRALVALAVGMACSRFLHNSWWVALAVIVVGLLAAFFTRGLTLYMALAGAGAFLAPLRLPPSVPEALYAAGSFQGVVVDEPLAFRRDRMVVRVSGPGGGRVIVWADDSLPCVRYGDEVVVSARLSRFSFPRNPGMADPNVILRRRGYVGQATVMSRQVQIVARGRGCPLTRLVVMPARRYIYRAAGELLPGPAGALLLALLLGDREGLPEQFQTAFVEGGVVHVLVVSGLHVGMIAIGAWLLLAVFGLRGWLAFGLTSAAVGLYVLMAGASPAPVRAGLMACGTLLSIPTQRRVNRLAGLCTAGIVLLLIDPAALFDVGAQLSFTATLAIVVVLSLLERNRRLGSINPLLRKWLFVPLAVSTAATLGTGPLLLHCFGRVQLLAPISSLIAVPAVSLSLLASSVVLVVNLLWSALAGVMAGALGLLLESLLLAAGGLGRLSVTMWEPGAIGWQTVFWLYSLGLLGMGWRMRWTRMVLGAALGLGLIVFVWRPALSGVQTRVTFLDPGRGDAILLEDTLGRRLLVDAGIDGTGVLRDFLRIRGIRRLDVVVVSHPDRDHYGGLLDLGPNIKIERLLVSTLRGEDTTYESLIRRLKRHGTRVLIAGAGTKLEGFGFDIGFAAPEPTTRRLYEKGFVPSNMVSLVATVSYNDLSMLLTGDMDDSERLQSGHVWLVKAPHHGSRKGNPLELYRRLRPKYVVTMGRFPTRAGLEDWLGGLGATDINTRRDGGVALRFGRNGPTFSRD